MSSRRKSIIPGLIIILIGIFLLVGKLRVFRFDWEIHFPLILALIGVLLLINAIFRREKGGVFIGTILLIVGGFYYARNVYLIPYYYLGESWPIFPLSIGIAFFTTYIFKPKEWGLLIPGFILTLFGIFFLLEEMFYVSSYTLEEVFSWWPIILIIIGTAILLNNLLKKPQNRKEEKGEHWKNNSIPTGEEK